MEQCKECGSKSVTWHVGKKSRIPDGKLRMHDVVIFFYLGCDYCSETLKSISENAFMNKVNNSRS